MKHSRKEVVPTNKRTPLFLEDGGELYCGMIDGFESVLALLQKEQDV